MTPKTLTRIGIALCIIGLLFVPAAAASGQSMVLSLSVSEVIIHVDEEIKAAGYTIDGKPHTGSVFVITGGKTTLVLETVPEGKELTAEVFGGQVFLGDDRATITTNEPTVIVSLSLVPVKNSEWESYDFPIIRAITEIGDFSLEKSIYPQIAELTRTGILEKILALPENI